MTVGELIEMLGKCPVHHSAWSDWVRLVADDLDAEVVLVTKTTKKK